MQCVPVSNSHQSFNPVCIGITLVYVLSHSSCVVCPVNEYVGGSPDACQPCPAMSSSPGGVVRVCTCMDGTGRINESDPSLPCVGESLRATMKPVCNTSMIELHLRQETALEVMCKSFAKLVPQIIIFA